MSKLITINLTKGPGASWGFRLQGGKDFAQPLCIQKVNIGSVAETAGLQAGDAIVSIGSTDALSLRHKEAQDSIVKAGNSFAMVIQRGAMTWRPQVTVLSQPKKTAEGPVITQTSLAASGKQPTKTSPRLNIGSSHNNSPRPFPGSGNWAATNTTPIQSPVHHQDPATQLYFHDTPPESNNRSRSLLKSSSTSTTNGPMFSETLNESRTVEHSTSHGSLRGLSLSPTPYRTQGDGATMSTSRSSSNARKNLNECVEGSLEKTFKSSSYSSNTIDSTRRSVSSNSLSNQIGNFKEDVNSLQHGSYIATGNSDMRCPSPLLATPSPPKRSQSPRVVSPSAPLRTPSPNFNPANNTQSSTIPCSDRCNRSPSPYYNSNNSRTPRSLSPSCSIPSLLSTSSVIGGSSVSVASLSPTTRSTQHHDVVSDFDMKSSLKIDGADISLDKENARNFLKMQLDKERERDCAGVRKVTKTTSRESFMEEHHESYKDTNHGKSKAARKFSQDSRYAYKPDDTDFSLINTNTKSYFTNKSSDNIFSAPNPANINNVTDNGFVTNSSGNNSVTDNIKKFNAGRRHSSFFPTQVTKRDDRSHTLDRNANTYTSSYQRSPASETINKYSSLNNRSSSNRGGSAIRRTSYGGSYTNLSSSNKNNAVSPGANCNVPWKNHFSNLRRKSGGSGIRGVTDTTAATHDDAEQQRAPKGFNAAPAGFGEVNGQPIVNPQYNSPINLYNEESIAEALSSQSEILGQGCLGVNFMKSDRAKGVDPDSDVLKMVQEMDKAPRTPPVATGTSSAYAGTLTPSEMIGTPEIPVQGASFRILERYLGGEEQGSRPGSNVSSPVSGSGPSSVGAHPTRSVQAPVTKPRTEGDAQAGGATVCSQCERPIIGVFVRIKNKNLHADCFKCNTCGTSLKNVGYYNISDKLYCDVHAKQAAKHNPPGPNLTPITVQPGATPPAGAMKAPQAPAPAQEPEPITPVTEEVVAAPTPPPVETQPQEIPDDESLPSSPLLEELSAVVHEASAPQEAAAPVDVAETPAVSEEQPPVEYVDQPADVAAQGAPEEVAEAQVEPEEIPAQESVPEAEAQISAEPEPQQEVSEEPQVVSEPVLEAPIEPEQQPQAEAPSESQSIEVKSESELEIVHPEPEPEPELIAEPEPEILEALPVEEPVLTREEPVSPVVVATPEPAPTFAPAPIPIQPSVAPAFFNAAPGGSSANPAAFGAPSGDVNVRSHIPKKGPVAPAPVFSTPKAAPAPAPAPVVAPVSIKPVAAPAPAPAPMFGGGGLPKPAPPPGMGGLAKPPGMGGPPTKGIPGERTAPKRGRGIMTPANVSRVPMCANCHRQIRGPFVTALGKNWCPDHFHCATESCRKQLIDLGFVEEQGALHCEDCYEKYLAPTCGKCDKRIKGDCLNAVGKQFHPECFACAYCGKVFGSGAFYLEDGLPYCETDWNDLFTTKCVGCGFPIEAGDRWVEALNNNYHSQCFKCSKCHKNLEGQSFFAKGGKPFCKAHAQRGF